MAKDQQIQYPVPMLPTQRNGEEPKNLDPVERFKNQFPAYAANHSDDGEEPRL